MGAYVYIDVSQKQEFIYKNSKLSENLYNSFIIKAVTEKLFDEESSDLTINDFKGINHGVTLQSYLQDTFNGFYHFVYSGGGNSIIYFDSKEVAQKFIKGYSRRILEVFPDLELYISLVDEMDPEIQEESNQSSNFNRENSIRRLLIQRCDELKDQRKAQFKRWSYGIEVIEKEGTNQNVDYIKQSRGFLYKKFEKSLCGVATLTSELKDYQKNEEGKSYIGVISIDGNKMGEMVKAVRGFEQLGVLSNRIEEIYFQAIVTALREYHEEYNIEGTLLYTPILQAGDDICLIVEAENAIEIAAAIIENIGKISLREDNKAFLYTLGLNSGLSACGGVAIARNTYPFFELVKIAESLCHQAKMSMHKCVGLKNSFLTWEVVGSQVEKKVNYEHFVRQGNKQVNYHIKPLCIDQTKPLENDIFSYQAFKEMVGKIQTGIKESSISSSFLEELKKRMYEGIEGYRLYVDTNINHEFLSTLSENVFKGSNDDNDNKEIPVDKYMVRSEKINGVEHNWYILNDVIEVLPFFKKKGGVANATAAKVSN